MRKLQIPLIVVALIAAFGCSSGDTPVETVQTQSKPPQQDSMKASIQNNSQMPQVAKDALLGKRK